ncbi:hypothetical protein EHS25_007616 [Saitozyma podzolica]|uniref:Uncharacterized protein n=1 Tax=Saitozyma podzolica TaxID=1890683 RepID=A0A427YQ90_9TREE|nr:hypothetical protein EHS25_007616 [Saitozyma podzolica]
MDVLAPYLPAMQGRLNKLGLMDLYAVIGLLMATYLGSWLVKFIHVRWQVRGLPVIHSAIEIFESGARTKFPHIPFVIPVKDFTLDDPWKKYATAQSDLIACTQLSTPYAVYITSNPSVAASISAKPASVFGKPTGMSRYQAINIYGLQIVSTQTGPEHRRHKNVVKGCFGEAVMQNGFEKMMRAKDTMVREERLEDGGKIDATLLVIGQAGFDYTIPWDIPETNGPLLPFGEALHVVEHSMIPQLLLPTWLMDYSPIAT